MIIPAGHELNYHRRPFIHLLNLKKITMKHVAFLLIVTPLLLFSCKSKMKNTESSDNDMMTGSRYALTEAWRTDTLLKTPESVLYDPALDVLFVSDLNMNPMQKDENGFISKLSTTGEILDLEWVTGLSSPKGMAIVGNTLYVADVDEIVAIDIDNARIEKKIPVDGAGMLNDIAADANGKLYISDTQTNKIHTLENGELGTWISEGLSGPNGLYAEPGRILLATNGSQEFCSINPETRAVSVLVDSIGAGDGIAYTGMTGYYLVSDWSGEVWLVDPDMNKTSLLNTSGMNVNSADITFIPDKHLLLVPTFFENRVVAYTLGKK